MRYYWIKEREKDTFAPRIQNWFSSLDVRKLKPGHYGEIPYRMLFSIEENPNTVFSDIVPFPFFLVSEVVKACIQLYEPNLEFKEFILLDSKNRKAKEYFLPEWSEIACLTKNSQFNLDHSRLNYIELDPAQIGDKSIFTLADVKSRYVIARLDVLESLLRRNANGFAIEEVNTAGGNGCGKKRNIW